MQIDVWQRTFALGVWGAPFQMLVLAWLAGVLVFVESVFSRGRWLVHVLALLCVLAASIVMLLWAAEGRAWANALEMRSWSIVLIVPIMVLALADRSERLNRFRQAISLLLAAGFVSVLLLQAHTWMDLTRELDALLISKTGCVEARQIEDLHDTALGNWTVTAQSIALQGKEVKSIAYFYESCTALDFRKGYWLSNLGNWDYHFWGQGWFDKNALRRAVAGDTATR